MPVNRRFLLVRRPAGTPVSEDFRIAEEDIPVPAAGSFVVRNHYASLDPAQRGWMDDAPSYMPPIPLGDAVRATTVGIVHASANPGFAAGDWVLGLNGIEDYSVVQPGGFTMKIDVSQMPSPTKFLSAMGAVGLTAYFGLLEDAKPQPGETLLVSGSAGAVGSAVGQIGKIKGCRVIGIAGGPEKCAMVARLGADAVVDRKDPEWRAQLKQTAPDGIDRLFENSGGPMFEAAISLLNDHARIALCGLIDGYNLSERPAGPSNFGTLLTKRVLTQGFIVLDYMDRAHEVEAYLADLIASGNLTAVQAVLAGLDSLPGAFIDSFTHGYPGKVIVDVRG